MRRNRNLDRGGNENGPRTPPTNSRGDCPYGDGRARPARGGGHAGGTCEIQAEALKDLTNLVENLLHTGSAASASYDTWQALARETSLPATAKMGYFLRTLALDLGRQLATGVPLEFARECYLQRWQEFWETLPALGPEVVASMLRKETVELLRPSALEEVSPTEFEEETPTQSPA